MRQSRRQFLEQAPLAASAVALGDTRNAIVIDPKPLFEISPYLYMQFMEPLGITECSVEAAWDYNTEDWRKDFVDVVRDLAPGCVRWGGLYSRYYKWREGIGPSVGRPAHRNYMWGGKETNRVGTGEFVDFCRRVGAEPLYCVNFLSDGFRHFWNTPREGNRSGDAREAADWVAYANDPDNRERRSHGSREPYRIRLWQLGNETSYGKAGFTLDECIEHTVQFATAMRERDPSIELIGWGDRGSGSELWAGELLHRAGDLLDYVAIHLMGQKPRRRDTVLSGLDYERAPEQAWEELIELSNVVETRVTELEQVITASGSRAHIAVTEGHLSLAPHNANPILREWLSAAYHARSLNVYQRHGATVKIATAADFAGTRWTVNAVMMQVPAGISYLMPVGAIMRLFGRHNGEQGVAVKAAPSGLDVAASRTGNRLFLHVANLEFRTSMQAAFSVEGMTITGGKVFQIAPERPRLYADQDHPNAFTPVERPIPWNPLLSWRFPATSVSVVELELVA